MSNAEHTTNFTAEQLREMRRAGMDESDWQGIATLSEKDLEQAIAEDEEWSGIPAEWYQQAALQIPTHKKQLTIRLDQDIFNWFKGHGKGYQTRINSVLRSLMEANQHIDDRQESPK